MSKERKKVIVLSTSCKTRGGITAVVNAHKSQDFWGKWNCVWIETHIDKTIWHKLFYAIKSLFIYLYNLPLASLVHVHLSAPNSVKRKYIFLLLAKLFRKPVIIHFHAFSSTSSVDDRFKNLYKKVFSFADLIIVLSRSWKLGLINELNVQNHKIKVLYNPCPAIDLNMEVEKSFIILYAGVLDERKNFKALIKSFSLIAEKYPEWRLVFAGNGAIDEAKKLANELDVSSQVEFKGWIIDKEKHKLFSEASIFCLPSFAEGFPMAVLDAWAYHLPVITTSVGGIPDIAIDGENMLLFKPDDIHALANKLEKLLVDEELRCRLSRKSKELSEGIFSVVNITRDLDVTYSKLINDFSYDNV